LRRREFVVRAVVATSGIEREGEGKTKESGICGGKDAFHEDGGIR
jgi:hypothetical protein